MERRNWEDSRKKIQMAAAILILALALTEVVFYTERKLPGSRETAVIDSETAKMLNRKKATAAKENRVELVGEDIVIGQEVPEYMEAE